MESGIFASLHKLDVPLWIDGENVEFRDGMVRKSRGWVLPSSDVTLFDSVSGNFDDATGNFDDGGDAPTFSSLGAGPFRGLQQQKTLDDALHLFWGNTTNLFHSTGGAGASVGSGFTGQQDEGTQPATQWSMTPWGDWMVATNGVDNAQIYKGASFAALGNAAAQFTTAEIVRALRFHAARHYVGPWGKPG